MAKNHMAKKNLRSLSLGALVKLRDEVGAMIGRRADALKQELGAMGEDYKHVGRIAIYGKKKAKQMRSAQKPARKSKRKAASRKRRTKAAASARGRTQTRRAAGMRKRKTATARKTTTARKTARRPAKKRSRGR
ncbi:MAG: hypothetical protein ACRECO_22550 [Xanthobacteraceae bacterium]